MQYEERFSKRLIQLRMQKGVSAREMSLSIGQNASYINNIETGKALPSMSANTWIFLRKNFSMKPRKRPKKCENWRKKRVHCRSSKLST